VSGALTIAVAGFIIDKLRVKRALFAGIWVVSATVICILSILAYQCSDKAIAKNGSLATYVRFACSIGLYAAIMFSVAINLIARLSKRQRTRG
jgi:MFS family permease